MSRQPAVESAPNELSSRKRSTDRVQRLRHGWHGTPYPSDPSGIRTDAKLRRGGPEHDQADLEGAEDRARTAASAPILVGDVHQGALSGMAAADFFTVEVLSVLGLVRYHVLF